MGGYIKTSALHAKLLLHVLFLICCVVFLLPHHAQAGPVSIPGFYGPTITPPKPTTLPVLKPGGVQQGVSSIQTNSSNTQLTITQNQQNALIDWSSFNIGANASVQFYQGQGTPGTSSWTPQPSYAVLNRIWDSNPSLIFGQITADGRVFLINQNGILFGPGSQVNVNSLVASAVNIKNSDFLSGSMNFYQETGSTASPGANDVDLLGNPYSYSGITFTPFAAVSNYGEINASQQGNIFLIGPLVENGGLINAPLGQIGLVAGSNVNLVSPGTSDTSRSGYYVVINNSYPTANPTDHFGEADNQPGGNLYSDGGMVGMYGNNVNQWGVIRAMTAYQNMEGQVELRAANTVTTGANSSISIPVNPSTTETVSDTFQIYPIVYIGGLTGAAPAGMGNSPASSIVLNGSITAPTGQVTLNAVNSVTMTPTSSIDVSGVVATLPVPVIAGFEMNSIELRDDYVQKGGVLQGQDITTPLVAGSAIGDLTQEILTRDMTALERCIGGAMTLNPDGSTYSAQIGHIDVTVSNGNIDVQQGANLNFSGGLINYTGGLVNTTKLLSGTTIYDISNAPASIQYSQILGNYENIYNGFGITQSYTGLYYGGSSPLKTYVQGYTQAGDAGELTLSASNVVLAGTINGSVKTPGVYQNTWTTSGSTSAAMALSVDQGLEAPSAGTLTIGNSNEQQPSITNPLQQTTAISIVSDTTYQSLSQSQQILSPTPGVTPTYLSAKTLNNAGLANIDLYSNLTISMDSDVSLNLQPGGSFNAYTRRIDIEGGIKIPQGTITLETVQNITSAEGLSGQPNNQNYQPLPNGLPEGIVLGPTSSLDVSGKKINLESGNVSAGAGLTAGGSVSLLDETDLGSGVFIMAGAVVDVSGGYIINQSGNVTGGNAGFLSIQGSNIMLGGDLRGYALADANGDISGGSIILTSTNITVSNTAQVWPSSFDPRTYSTATSDYVLPDNLILAGNSFDNTGFTNITLYSINNIVIDQNTTIAPSLVRLNNPTGSSFPGQAVAGQPDLITLDASMAFMAGASSFIADAGQSFAGATSGSFAHNLGGGSSSAQITISPGTLISTTPTPSSTSIPSSISIGSTSAAGVVDVDVYGEMLSLGGDISVLASSSGNLTVEQGAQIIAKGYNQPVTTSVTGNFQPISAGKVALSAGGGVLTLYPGSTIDISGSGVVTNTVLSGGMPTTYSAAGNPGTLSLTYDSYSNGTVTGTPNLQGIVNASTQMKGIQGGALTISMKDPTTGMQVAAENIESYTNAGFDNLTLKSPVSLTFNDTLNLTIGQQLTLDAPIIQGNGQSGQSVTLSAPWITLQNSSPAGPSQASFAPVPDSGSFTLSSSGWIDVIGSTQISGFQNTTLFAAQDISLSQVLYGSSNSFGMLATTGNLTMDAARIYPGNFYKNNNGTINTIYPDIYSDYTLYANGNVTIQHTSTSPSVAGPIYSAGGSLTVTSAYSPNDGAAVGGIDVENGGYLAAPLGSITLNALNSRIFLAAGSVLTTAGNGAAVNYGLINSNNQWVVESQTNPNGANSNSSTFDGSTTLPPKGVNLSAAETIVMNGSSIDISGGGSVFAYQNQPGLSGSNDPLAENGRYVVFQGNSFQMPGQEVYLQGGGGLSAGYYTLLPLGPKNDPQQQNERYAFMPGAYILQLQTTGASLPAQGSLSQNGYPVTIGYSAVANTTILSTQPQVYSVRTAASVIAEEGDYIQPSYVSGNGGSINVQGNTTIINGSINAAALAGYQGGTITLAATNINVLSSAATQLSNFSFGTSLNSSQYQNLIGNLTISADSISGKGFGEINLGNIANNTQNPTQSVTIGTAANPVVLAADVINLAASQSITIYNDSQLQALTGAGEISLTTPVSTGNLIVDNGAVLNASNNINVNVNNMQGFRGALQSGAITLQSNNAIFYGSSSTGTLPGLYLTSGIWNNMTGKDITLVSTSSSIKFSSPNFTNVNYLLSAVNSLTLDAQQILGDGYSSVALQAPTVNIRNSSGASSQAVLPTNINGTFTVTAPSGINIGGGDVLFDGFSSINFSTQGDFTLMGKGSLTTGTASLEINAPRVTTAGTTTAVTNSDGTTSSPVTAANFFVYTGPNYFNDQNNLSLTNTNTITINGNGGTPGQTNTPGGMLQFWGSSIEINNGGIIQVDSGTINLTATGVNPTYGTGIYLHNGSEILAPGIQAATASAPGVAPGGNVTLSVVNGSSGSIVIDSSSLVNVKAGTQGDAGGITLLAPLGGVSSTLGNVSSIAAGSLLGNAANGGAGGSLTLSTYQLLDADMTSLIGTLAAGGFTESVNIRTHTGNIDIAANQTLTAYNVTLTSDGVGGGGNINVNVSGSIDASSYAGQTTGGTVGLYANNNINIDGNILAEGLANGSTGGYVLLNSELGSINVNGTINVKGNVAGGTTITGDTVYLRAPQSGSGVNINLSGGSIIGAAGVYVEAFESYNYQASPEYTVTSTAWAPTVQDYTTWLGNAAAYYNSNTAVSSILNTAPALAGVLHLLPGIEVDNNLGDINWNIDTTQTTFESGLSVPGVLTLRAGGNLNINANLVDAPVYNASATPTASAVTVTSLPAGINSWGFNLVAGADLNSANYMAVNPNVNGNVTGNLNIADSTLVYTESAPINFASAVNTVIGGLPTTAPGYMINNKLSYNLGSFTGNIQGYAGQDLMLNGGAIQTATGNIDITVGRDLNIGTDSFGNLGAIRTTGQAPQNIPQGQPYINNSTATAADYYWDYSGGGDIALNVGRYAGTENSAGQWSTAVNLNGNQWDSYTQLVVPGVADESLKNSNDRLPQFSANYTTGTAGIATMGGGNVTVHTGSDFLVQAGTFGLIAPGNLIIYAGGNISGRFLNADGQGSINAMGNFGSYGQNGDGRQQIELFSSQMTVTAQGDIQIDAVVNPSLASDQAVAANKYFVDCTYNQYTSIYLNAGGNVTIAGQSPFYTNSTPVVNVMPATVNVNARGGNIYLLNSLYLTSSPIGQLSLTAKGSIIDPNTPSEILMSDIATSYWYGISRVPDVTSFTGSSGSWIGDMDKDFHGYFRPVDAALQVNDMPLHLGDNAPVNIQAGGDIENLIFLLPKQADLTAGGDIVNVTYEGQNIGANDVSQIVATGNITMQYSQNSASSLTNPGAGAGLIQGGPGAFLVQAGGLIDLGTSPYGIQAIGNGANPVVGTGKSNLIVVAGYTFNTSNQQDFNTFSTGLSTFFSNIQSAGDEYANMLADGNLTGAASLLQSTRTSGPYAIDNFLGKPSGAGDIDMIFSQIATSIGQSNIYIIAAGTLNVGQSALPTAGSTNANTGITTGGGGSINIFANGDVNVNESRIMTFYGGDITIWSDDGSINAGRGSSTAVSALPPKKEIQNGVLVTVFSPPAIGSGIRAVTYGFNPPPTGDIHLFAPNGIINAGEAGISGGEVILAALHVVNAFNISFTSGSVGVPLASTGAIGLGALSGQSSVATQSSQALSDISGAGVSKAPQASQMLENVLGQWLDVKVIDFVQDEDQ
jgi:filamentous hemagglutinin family protein